MKKTSSLILASLLIVGGISTASPAFAGDGNGNGNGNGGVGHTPVYLCHNGKVLIPDDSSLQGHLDHGDIQLPSTPTPEKDAPCGPVQPESPAPSTTSAPPSSPPTTASPSPSASETSEPLIPTFPTKPTVEFPDPSCGGVPGKLMIPSTPGVDYSLGDAHMGKIIVTATPKDGYIFEGKGGAKLDQKIQWEITVVDNTQCPIPSQSPTSSPTQSTSPSAEPTPTFTDIAVGPTTSPMIPCDVLGRVNIPATDPAYDSRNDRDKDGYACDDHQPTKGLPVPEQTGGGTLTSTSTETSSVQPLTAPVTTSAASPVQPEQLAYTGADKTGWAVVGGILVLLGLLFLVAPKLLPKGKH